MRMEKYIQETGIVGKTLKLQAMVAISFFSRVGFCAVVSSGGVGCMLHEVLPFSCKDNIHKVLCVLH